MSDTFNDGDPIDAALLQKLKTDVASALAASKAKAVAGSNINAGGTTTAPGDINPRTFFGGRTGEQKVIKSKVTTFLLDYTAAGFSGKPSAISVTAISSDGFGEILSPYIVKNTITSTTASAQVWGIGDPKNIALYFIAVKNQS
jgi:hypothetical protein